MVVKCNSCRSGFDGRNGNGYSPCGCAIHVKTMSEAEMIKAKDALRKAMEQHLKDNPLYSKRIQIEPKPEFVPPPGLILSELDNDDFEYIPPINNRAWFYFLVGLVIGFLIGWVL